MSSIQLHKVLAELFPSGSEARRIAKEAQLKTGHIDFSGSSVLVWDSVVEQALKEAGLGRLMAVVVGEAPALEARIVASAHEHYGDDEDLRRFLRERCRPTPAPSLS